MWMIAGWLVWLGAGSPAADATAKPHVRFEEPPLEFVLELDGQETDAVEGETRRVTVGGRSVEASFSVRPTRLLRTSQLSFRFPRQFEFERNAEKHLWALARDGERILLMEVDPKEDLSKAIDALIEGFEEKSDLKPVPAELRLGGRTVRGKRARGKSGLVEVAFDAYGIAAGKASYILVRSEAHRTGETAHPTTVAAWKVLADTFAFAESEEPVDKAPFEYSVTLAGVSLDLVGPQARTITAGGGAWKARVRQGDMRTLRAPDVTLRYPFFYEFKGEVAEDGTDVWSMDGGDQMVMLVRTRNGDEAAKSVQKNIDVMAEGMGKPATRPFETTFAQATRKGTRAEFKKDAMTVTADFFPFTAGGSGYVLIFTQSSEGGAVAPIYRIARSSIEKSVTIVR